MAYADIAELQRVLRIDAPTAAQTDAMTRVLEAAAEEIDWELDYTVDSRPCSAAADRRRRQPRPGRRAVAAQLVARLRRDPGRARPDPGDNRP
jgi:hypothetical protein